MSRTRKRNGTEELRTPYGWKTRKQAPIRWDAYDAEQERATRGRKDRDRAAMVRSQDQTEQP